MTMPLYRKLVMRQKGLALEMHRLGHVVNCRPLRDAEIFEALDRLGGAVCIDCTEAHQFLSKQKIGIYDKGAYSSSPVPFSRYWVEWVDSEHFNTPHHIGAMVETVGVAEIEGWPDPVQQVIAWVAVSMKESQHTYWAPLVLGYYISGTRGAVVGQEYEDGRFGISGCASYADRRPDMQDNKKFHLVVQSSIINLNWFMQVRNVRYEQVVLRAKDKKQLARGQSHKIDFRTLKISREIARHVRPSGPASLCEMPLHLVMGHFKCYDDKPLFGRITGTFFWQAHTRGKAEHGRIEKAMNHFTHHGAL